MNKREIKKISYDFRCSASAVMTSHSEDLLHNIRLFMLFIKQNPLIMQYVNSLPDTNNDIEKAIVEVISNPNVVFRLGETIEDSFRNTFKLLDSPSLDERALYGIILAYRGNSSQYQDMAKNFCQRIILPFIRTIQQYLAKIEIDMGMDDNIQYSITVNGGQVNLSQDNSTINAVQNNGIDQNKIQSMIDAILTAAQNGGVAQEQIGQINEILYAIKDELTKPTPKRAVITTLKNELIAFSTGFATIPALKEAVDIFVQFIAPFIF